MKKNLTGPQLVATSRLQREFLGLQKKLEEHMGNLMEAQIYGSKLSNGQVESSVAVADLFNALMEFKFGSKCGNWQYNMRGCRIPWLRKVATYAAAFGLKELAGIIRKHITLRRMAR